MAQVKPQTAGAIADEGSKDGSGETSLVSEERDSKENANNSIGQQDEAIDSNEAETESSVVQATQDAGVSAAPAIGNASNHAQERAPLAALTPGPTAVADDAVAPSSDGESPGSTDADATSAEQIAVPLASVPAEVLAGSHSRGLRAAEVTNTSIGSVQEPAEPALLPDAQLSLSGDRLSEDATCALLLLMLICKGVVHVRRCFALGS